MVRNYIKKKHGPGWSHETLQRALTAIGNQNLSLYAASSQFGIPRATLFDHITGRRGQKSKTLGRPTTLPIDTEKTLATCIRTMEKNGFGLSRKEVVELVAEYVKHNNLESPFKNGVPGYDWFSGFVSRHNLSIKKPQAVEYARKQAADPFVLDDYFKILENTIYKLNLQNKPNRIWNIDETSYSHDPKKTKVVGVRGFASTRTTATSGKENTTVLFASNAAGEKGPPFIIFKGKNVWSEWTSPEAYPGTLYTATENGWIESKAFADFFSKSFVPMIDTTDEPTLLIFDGHSTHIQLAVIETAIQNNITIIKLPPHTSHLLQPLDLSVFKPFKDKWDEMMMKWQRSNYGKKLSKQEFSKIVGEVWRSLNPKILQNGFKKGGIFPLDKTVVSEDKLDQSALKRWKEHKKVTAIDGQLTISRLSTLSSMCVKKIDEIFITKYDASATNHSRIPSIPSDQSSTSSSSNIMSFEELLLGTIRKHESTVTIKKKIKIARGAEVITHSDVVKKVKQKEEEKLKKEVRSKIKLSNNIATKRNSTKVTKKIPNAISATSTSTYPLSTSKSSTYQETKIHNPKNIIITSNEHIDDCSTLLQSVNKEGMIKIDKNSKLLLHTKNKGIAKKRKQMKKERKEKDETSTDESDFSVHDMSDYENLSDILNLEVTTDNDFFRDFDIDDENINNVNFTQTSKKCSVNDWVLVQFSTKKTIKHFVGQVKSIVNEVPSIKYVRKIHKAKKDSIFAYPIIDDVCDLKHSEDLVTVLPQPDISRRGHIIFKIHFDKYNIQ